MQQYLYTSAELKDASLADLGPMDRGSYSDFMAKAEAIGAQRGVKPRLMLDIKFRPGAHPMGLEEFPYPVSEVEWGAIVADARTMTEFMPSVHVVDYNRYTGQI